MSAIDESQGVQQQYAFDCVPTENGQHKEPAIWGDREVTHLPPSPENEIQHNLSFIPSLKSAFIRNIYFAQLQEQTKAISYELRNGYLKSQFDCSQSPTSLPEVDSRFAYIHCPRDTAVKVEDRFLHANFVNDVNGGRSFVAALSPKDFLSFWQFICEITSNIIDLDTTENQCYPTVLDEERMFNDISVKLLWLEQTEDEETYKYLTEDHLTGKSRIVTRCHFKAWNDTSGMTVAKLKSLVQKLNTFFAENSLIHCETGRATGTLIAAYFLTHRIRQGRVIVADLGNTIIDIIGILKKQRGPDIVQTKEDVDLLFDLGLDLIIHPEDEALKASDEQIMVDPHYAARCYLPQRAVPIKVKDQTFETYSFDADRTFYAYKSPTDFREFWRFISDSTFNCIIDLDTFKNPCYPASPETCIADDISVKPIPMEPIEGGPNYAYLVEDHLTGKSKLVTRYHYKSSDISSLDCPKLKHLAEELKTISAGKTLVCSMAGVAPIVTIITARLFKEQILQRKDEIMGIHALYEQVRKQHGSFFLELPEHLKLLDDVALDLMKDT